MPEVKIALTVLVALVLGIRASWVWLLRGRNLVPPWRGTMGSVAISLVILDCLVFVRLFCFGQIGGFGTHYMTTRMVGWYLLASIAITSGAALVKGESRWETFMAGLLTTGLWFGSGFVA